jgi:hypothetical protein
LSEGSPYRVALMLLSRLHPPRFEPGKFVVLPLFTLLPRLLLAFGAEAVKGCPYRVVPKFGGGGFRGCRCHGGMMG